ncbi:MAG: PAS domain S-box protein [Gaiellaceae bacterium]
MIVDAQDLIQTTLLGEAAENAPLGIFVADEEMAYVAVNRRGCELVGYEREELLSLKVSDISPSPPSQEHYAEMIARGKLSGRGPLLRKDGTEVDVEFWAYSTRVAQMTVYVAFIRPLDEPT